MIEKRVRRKCTSRVLFAIFVSFVLTLTTFSMIETTVAIPSSSEGDILPGITEDYQVNRVDNLASDEPLGFPPSTTLWDYRYNVHSTDLARGMTRCTDDGYAVVGQSWGLLGWAQTDGFLIKTNSSGEREWTMGYGHTAEDSLYSVEECASGGFILVGRTKSYGAGNEDIWLIRTDSSGNMLWNRTFGGTGTEYGYAVTECSSGFFAIAGYTTSFGAGGNDAWIIMTNSTGHHEWNVTLGGSSQEIAYDLLEASDGNLTIVGYTNSFGAGGHDLWLIHMDYDGFQIWNQTYGGTGTELGEALVECSSGGYAMTGTTTTYNGGAWYYSDSWLVRVDAVGGLLWHKSYPKTNPDFMHDLVESQHGGFMIVGETIESGDWAVLLIRTNSTGNQLWNWTYVGGDGETCSAIVEIADSGFALTGYSKIVSEYECHIFGVPDTPFWEKSLPDQSLEYGIDFLVDVNATIPHGVSHWWINDTSNFAIDQDGKVTNLTTLSLGDYGIEVSVNDTLNHILEGEFTLTITDSTNPTWDEPASNRMMELGHKFSYNLNASDTFGIHHYWVNDSAQFTIDGNGVIANISMIPVGMHGIEVRAYDPSDNYCSTELTLTVEDTTAPTWVETPPDRILEFSQMLRYDLNATDLSGITSYWFNASSYFYMIGGGVFEGGATLPVGTHAIEVRAYDPYDHYCSCVIIITVVDTLPPEWDEVPDDKDAEYG